MLRRRFLQLLGGTAAAAITEQLVPNNRVWFIPKTVKPQTPKDFWLNDYLEKCAASLAAELDHQLVDMYPVTVAGLKYGERLPQPVNVVSALEPIGEIIVPNFRTVPINKWKSVHFRITDEDLYRMGIEKVQAHVVRPAGMALAHSAIDSAAVWGRPIFVEPDLIDRRKWVVSPDFEEKIVSTPKGVTFRIRGWGNVEASERNVTADIIFG